MEYAEIEAGQAYELQNPGGLVLVCTKGADGRYDLSPVAWCCPLDYAPTSRILLVLDTGHRVYEDLSESGEFALALPTAEQVDLVMRTGAASGRDQDKYETCGIKAFAAGRVDARIPEGVAGWLECRLLRVVVEGTSAVVMGEVLRAAAAPEAWKSRLHFVREGILYAPGPALSEPR
ncbi:MAG: flavin reductase family protein [Spirochaetaceae bacterium]|nr:flavin reductase family protein [Spirochaetaceae bacterium]